MEKNNTKIFIFLGPPGSGKGTLSKLCVDRLGWTQLSTGNLCRKHIAEQTEIGKNIDFAIKSGKLINDDLIINMVENWLQNNLFKVGSIILDGFPRTAVQAQALDKMLQTNFKTIVLNIVRMNVSDEIIIERLLNRVICLNDKCQAVYSLHNDSLKPKCEFKCDECSSSLVRRSDDDKISILHRLNIYRQWENELISFYHERGYKIEDFIVERPIEFVYKDFINILSMESL